MSGSFTPIHTLRSLALLVVLSLVAGVLVAGIALPAVGGAGLLGKTGADSFESLPSDLATPPLPERSRVLDKNGNELASFYQEYRVNVPLEKVDPIMRKAIIAIEDARFYEHGPLDFKGTMRALAQNQSGGSTQGGSTLTQQYVKQVQVEQAKTPEQYKEVVVRSGIKGYARKLQELRFAVTMEKKYSKDEILERYLNIAYFGDGAYGIEAAAQHFFSKSAADLELDQAALLAGLVRSPYAYDPTKHADVAKSRRDRVLQRMADTGSISQKEADEAKDKDLKLKVKDFPNTCEKAGKISGFFCQYVVESVKSDPAFGSTRTARSNLLFSGGLTIKTSLDPKAQRQAHKAMRRNVAKRSHIVGSLASVQPGTGKVRAMVVSRDFTTNKSPKRKQLNFNTAVDRAHGGGLGTQFGSNAKPFTLAAALQDGIPLGFEIQAPGSLSNMPFKTCDGNTITYPSVGNAAGEDDTGTYTLPEGTAKSVNTFFVKLEAEVGLCKTWRMTKKLGMVQSATGKPLNQLPSLTLGADTVDPLHVAAAYAAFGYEGKYCKPTPFEHVLDANGKKIPGLQPDCKQAMRKGAANAVASAMQGVFQPGGTAPGFGLPGRQAAGKTGTTNDNRAGWFSGYTPQMATSVSLASPVSVDKYPLRGADLGPRIASGFGKDAAPIWRDAMYGMHKGKKPRTFGNPPDKLEREVHLTIPVPDVTGMSPDDASATLQDQGFQPVVDPAKVESDQPEGQVAHTTPGAGSQARSGSTVTIFVSGGDKKEPTDKPSSDGDKPSWPPRSNKPDP
ncbi:MAG: PASTA domain-containing protein [Streptosporangiales bacterium]|nr:PASTA domain-containing protein [Streptosporangiales bacterium]